MSCSEPLLPSYEKIVKKKNHFVLTDAAGRKTIIGRDDSRFDPLLEQYTNRLARVYTKCMGGL